MSPPTRTQTLPTSSPARPARPPAVAALQDCGSGARHPLPEARCRLTLGSGGDCDIRVDDPFVSTVHCFFERRGGVVHVRDGGSKNGTAVNGNRVRDAEILPGDHVAVGRSRLVALGRDERPRGSARDALAGEHPAFLAALDRALRAARSDCSVLILGETGTGKELFARAIHEASRRARGPYFALNCGGISRELVASELFGHVRGAFTGADRDRDGAFRLASGGTLFLDELGELPAEQQPHLLRALETRMIRPVGAPLEQMVDIRLVAATNRLGLAGRSSPLRSDLYHRLATITVELPPLRERASDIPLLVRRFLAELEPQHGLRTVDADTLAAMGRAPWPGNVRQLRGAVQRAVALGDRVLDRELLLPREALEPVPQPFRERIAAARAAERRNPPAACESVDDAIRGMFQRAYDRHGSIRRAAESLGIPKSTFADRARRMGLRIESPGRRPG